MNLKLPILKQLPGRITPYLRVRHARGHGVHSPFVYGLIRNALMLGKGNCTTEGDLYRVLKMCGVNRRRAGQIQNLYNYCNSPDTVIYNSDNSYITIGGPDGTSETANSILWDAPKPDMPGLRIYTTGCGSAQIMMDAEEFRLYNGAVIVLCPHADSGRNHVCRKLIEAGDSVSIDNRGFMLFLYGTGLKPRHYKL